MNFQNKVIIVTGASKGIGKSIALSLHLKGANVFLISRDRNLKKVFKNFSNNKNNSYFIGDVTDERFVKKTFNIIYKKNNKIDALINNAGISGLEKINKITLKKWDHVINNNLKSSFVCSKIISKYYIKQNYGNIVNISSVAGRNYSIVAGVHYTASKAGVIGLTKQLAYELSKYNVRVNCIAPSQTKTETLIKSLKQKKINIKTLSNKLPLGRLAEPNDIANACLFLVSDQSSYINGSVIDVNGGII